MTKLQFYIAKSTSQLWVRPTLLSLAAITWVGVSFFADRFLPAVGRVNIEKDTLVNLFTILASTMLTVATFSVSAVAAAFGAVATSATPRATRIVMSDSSVQSTLAAFLGSFIYAVVSITALSAAEFGAPGRFMLFVGFVLLVGWVLMSFLRWVDRVSRLGKLSDTMERIRVAAEAAFADQETCGLLGGRDDAEGERPADGIELRSDRFGYVQYIDVAGLQAWMEDREAEIWLDVRPGSMVTVNAPVGVVRCAGKLADEDVEKLRCCITTSEERSYETDPRFAMILLAEVADRALSPAVNDPGTAIGVMTTQIKLLHLWAENDTKRRAEKAVKFDRVFVRAITAEDLLFDAFTPIARDGAGMIEVCLRLQKALRALMYMPHDGLRKAAEAYREIALELSNERLPVASQRKIVEEVARRPI